MLNYLFLVKWYIRKKAKTAGVVCPKNIEDILKKAVAKCSCEKPIYFSRLFGSNQVLNACATIPHIILVNAAWAAEIVLSQGDDIVLDAFFETIGHELTHQEHDYPCLKLFSKDRIFVHWVNEVHADFGGVAKALDSNRALAVNALVYKRNYKIKNLREGDQDKKTHPSWERRISYISKNDFNKKLIETIASDVKCENEELIHNVIKHFKNIELRQDV